MIEDSSQKNIPNDQLEIKRPRKVVNSDNMQRYKDLMGSFSVDKDIGLILSQRNILYVPSSPFQVFSFEVQQIVPASDFFNINIKMAHFALTITALRHYQLKKNDDQIKSPGLFGKISFSQFNNNCLCLKSLYYSNEQQFQAQFQRMVKEFTILKICSALECGPYLEKYFGFDIVIYDNCIQYATQKGQPIEQFTKRDQHHLQQQLTLLHQLKIIHYDIKPENIVFCHTYNKPVFIDFGFSQIVEQTLGLKTYGNFRGTPNYCTPQIFDLMMKEEDYADLYYNDAFCLSVTIKQLQVYQHQQMGKSHIDQSISNTQPSSFLFLFKYNYLNQRISESENNLLRYLFLEGNIKSIFEFVKQVFRYIFLLPKFEKSLSQYKQFFLYQEIMQEHKYSKEKIFFQRTLENDMENMQNMKSFIPQSFSANQQDIEGLEVSKNKKDYFRLFYIITKLVIFEEKTVWPYLSLVFSCVRFDVCNLPLEQKNLIALKINPLLADFRGKQMVKWQRQTQGTSELQQVKLLLRSILEFCLQSSSNSWSKDNLISILEQMIILDIDLSSYADRFLKFFKQSASDPLQQLFFGLQCNRLECAIRLVYSAHIDSIAILRYKYNQFMEKSQQKFKQYALSSTDQSIAAVDKIVTILKSDDVSLSQRLILGEKNILNTIAYPKIRRSVFYLAAIKNILNSHIIPKNDFAINKILQLKRYWESQKIPFFPWLEATLRFMKVISSDSEIRLLLKQVGKIINCQEIMNNNLLYNGWILRKSDQRIFKQMVKKLLISYPKLVKQNKHADFILHQLIAEISLGRINIDQQLNEQLHQIYYYYEKYHMKSILQSDPLNDKSTLNSSEIFWNAETQIFFCSFSPNTQGIFKFKLAQVQKTIQNIQKLQASSEEKGMFDFQLYLYQLLFYKLENKIQQCIDKLFLFISHCILLNQQKFVLQGLVRINQFACQAKLIPLIISSTNELYNFCSSNYYLFFYLLSYHTNKTFVTMAVFAQTNKQMFYKFIENLIHLLHDNPIDSYCSTFLTVIDKFLQKDPQHGFLIHYRKLQERFPGMLKNPFFLIFYLYSLGNEKDSFSKLKILKTICANVDRLSSFAKGKILENYFLVYLRFLRDKKFQRYLYNFRKAKIYLKQERVIFESRRVFRCLKNFSHIKDIDDIMKTKVRRAIKILENQQIVQ